MSIEELPWPAFLSQGQWVVGLMAGRTGSRSRSPVALAGASRSSASAAPSHCANLDAILDFRRGGIHQRRRQEAEAQAARASGVGTGTVTGEGSHTGTASPRSTLAQDLLQRWSLGSLSAATVQKIAHCAWQDGLHHPDIAKLASLGNHGQQPQNVQRDMLKWLQSYLGVMPTVLNMSLPMKTAVGEDTVHTVEVPLVPLHRMLSHMYEHWPAEFAKRVSGPPGALEEFWSQVKEQDPVFQSWKPHLDKRRNWQQHCLPFALHGDGVPVFRDRSLNVWSANFLLGVGNSVDTKFLLTCYWEALRAVGAENDTENVLWHYLLWDFEALWKGLHPSTDAMGTPWPQGSHEAMVALQPLAGNFFAAPWLLKADLDWLAKLMGLNHWGCNEDPCMFCKADRREQPFSDFTPTAAWKGTVWNSQQWKEQHPGRHKFFTFRGCGIHSVSCDLLHIVSLGVVHHIAGNVLKVLVWQTPWPRGTTLKERLLTIWGCIKEWYSLYKAPSRLGKLKWSMFLPDPGAPHQHYPLLHRVKAKEAEYLVRALQWVWGQHCNPEDEGHQHITAMLGFMVEFFDICQVPGHFLSDTSTADIVQAIEHILLNYSKLARVALDTGSKLWNIVMKFHYFWHLGQQCQWRHPRTGWTFADEDFMLRVSLITKASTGGIAINRLGHMTVTRHIRALYLRWSARLPSGGLHWT